MIRTEPLDWMVGLGDADRQRFAASLDASERAEFAYHWALFARRAQRPPAGDWRVWLICAGRGFGKTRAGAEWVREVAEQHPQARIALVAATLAEARAVMVEGESGIIACSPPGRAPVFEPSLQRLRFPNGALAQLYSAAEPERLRGPQHSHGCRAQFCGPGCNLSVERFTRLAALAAVDLDTNRVKFDRVAAAGYRGGSVRFLDGPQTGLRFAIAAVEADHMILDRPLSPAISVGSRARLTMGCDHTLQTCQERFSNAVNFRGEAHLPGNDLLTRYGGSL